MPMGIFVILLLAVALGGCRQKPTPCDSTPDPRNELPFGSVDAPRDRDTVGRMVTIVGWAADDSSVSTVHLYVDNKFRGSTKPTLPRPDVATEFPTYTASHSNVGWQTQIDLGETEGRHVVLAQAVDDRGATRDLGYVVVNLIGR